MGKIIRVWHSSHADASPRNTVPPKYRISRQPERRRPPHLTSPPSANGGAGTMQATMRLYRTLFGTRGYLRSICEGAAFLSASSIAIFAAVTYDTVHASTHVTDFVLSRVGPCNVRFLFVYVTFTAFVITAGLLAWRPN